MKELMIKFMSRKFILTIGVVSLAGYMPKVYKEVGVSDTVTLAVLALLGGVGMAYGFINVKDAQIPVVKPSDQA